MGAGGSIPATEEEALEAGYTREQINDYAKETFLQRKDVPGEGRKTSESRISTLEAVISIQFTVRRYLNGLRNRMKTSWDLCDGLEHVCERQMSAKMSAIFEASLKFAQTSEDGHGHAKYNEWYGSKKPFWDLPPPPDNYSGPHIDTEKRSVTPKFAKELLSFFSKDMLSGIADDGSGCVPRLGSKYVLVLLHSLHIRMRALPTVVNVKAASNGACERIIVVGDLVNKVYCV